MAMYKFTFTCIDDGGKHQCIKVKAHDISEAIHKGFEKARKKANGDITSWECELDQASLLSIIEPL